MSVRNKILTAAVFAALATTATQAQTLQSLKAKAAERAPQEEISIPFANHGGIDDWRADGNDALYIKGRGHDDWYHARLMSPCTGLPFADSIGFKSEPTGTFDRFSAVVVDGRRCHLTSLTRVDGPLPRAAARGG